MYKSQEDYIESKARLLIGKKFNSLKITKVFRLSECPQNSNLRSRDRRLIEVQCDCGEIKTLKLSWVRSGKVKTFREIIKNYEF